VHRTVRAYELIKRSLMRGTRDPERDRRAAERKQCCPQRGLDAINRRGGLTSSIA
jgi:hypothetical protein